MCRICGRMVKCIFDSMPSRTPTIPRPRSFSTAIRQSRHISSRQLLRHTFNTEPTASNPPPSFLLPHRAKLHQAVAAQQEATPAAHFQKTQSYIPPDNLIDADSQPDTDVTKLASPSPRKRQSEKLPSHSTSSPKASSTSIETTSTSLAPTRSSNLKPLVLSKSLQSLLPALLSQTPHYITTHIHRFPYLLTAGDTLRLPFHLHSVSPGDVLRFNRASIIGSRDYTLKAGLANAETYDGKRRPQPLYLDERLFECRVRVMGVESQPMTIKEKTKRRNRKVKTVRSKHRYTVLKVMEVRVKGLEELMREEGAVLLE